MNESTAQANGHAPSRLVTDEDRFDRIHDNLEALRAMLPQPLTGRRLYHRIVVVLSCSSVVFIWGMVAGTALAR